ncbi:MAG TPA: response regulator [Thermoflexia bacterium]|jgi:DNA-binding response OmpR family regulator|nr:response regulator [Thermoflexia bacterium]
MSTVLIVDDDHGMIRLLRTLFELEGFQVATVSSFDDVLPTCRKVLPDVILMDLRLRGQETLPLLRQIRQEDGLAKIPVVMTSGMDCGSRCLDAGADIFLPKPFLPDEVVRKVREVIRTSDTPEPAN